MRPAPHRALLDWLTIALFVGALLSPFADQLARPDSARDPRANERRNPAPRPSAPRDWAAAAEFPRLYEAHFEDTFGLRDVLLRWNARERWFGLGSSPSRSIVNAGGGWCFLDDGRSRDAHRGVLRLRAEEIEAWARAVLERRDALAARGVRYLFVVCPSKETIYPERAPATWARLAPTPLDRLAERLAREPGSPFLDLRPALLAAKAGDAPEDWVYTRFGTHWNGRGGHAAARAVLERLARDFPGLECTPPERCRIEEAPSATDSLAHQIYLQDRIAQRQYALVPAEPRHAVVQRTGAVAGARMVSTGPEGAPRLAWLHDSFGPFLEPLLCEAFSRVDARWTYELDLEDVLGGEPDVVLETFVERVLTQPPPGFGRAPAAGELPFDALADVAWSDDGEFGRVRGYGRAELSREDGALLVSLPTRRDGILIPALALGESERARLLVEVECSTPTALDVFVRAEGESSFLHRNRASAVLSPGDPAAVLALPALRPRFETLVRIASDGAPPRIRRLEVRRERAGAPGG